MVPSTPPLALAVPFLLRTPSRLFFVGFVAVDGDVARTRRPKPESFLRLFRGCVSIIIFAWLCMLLFCAIIMPRRPAYACWCFGCSLFSVFAIFNTSGGCVDVGAYHDSTRPRAYPSANSSASTSSTVQPLARQRSQGPAFRLRGGGINIVDDDDGDDDSSDHHPPAEDEDDYEDEEEDHDGDYEDDDEDEDESPDGSAVDDSAVDEDDDGLEYADDPVAVATYQQEERIRYQQSGWTSAQHAQYQRERILQEQQQQYYRPQHPRVIALEDYVEEDAEEGEDVVYHEVEDTSHKRARQQQGQRAGGAERQIVAPRYPRDQFGTQPYNPHAPPQVAFTDDELLGLPEDEVSDYPRIANKGKGKARADDSTLEEDEEEAAANAQRAEQRREAGPREESMENEEDLYAFLERRKRPSFDDDDIAPDADEPSEPHPLGDTENWLSDDAVARWAGAVARLDNPGAPKPIYGEMGEQRFKDEMERKRLEEIKAREPAPYRPDSARIIRQVGFEPVPVVPGTAASVGPATPPPGPPQVFMTQRHGWNDEPHVQIPPLNPLRTAGLVPGSPLPSPVAAPSALSMSLSKGLGVPQGMYPGYSPGTTQQQLPPSLPQPLVAHHYRRQQQQQQAAAAQDAWAQNGTSGRGVAMPVLRRGRGRSRSLDSSRSPSLAVRQAASSADYRSAKLRQELKKSLQKQEEKTRAHEEEKRARAREERGVQTGSRTEGALSVRIPRTREEQRERAEHRGRGGKGKEKAQEEDPSPTTSTGALPPSTHRPLPVLRSYRSRRIGTTDLAALRPAALNPTARPSVGVDDRTVHSAATSAATSTTSLLLGGSGNEVAALENWTRLERPPAEGAPNRSATTSSNVSPQATSPAVGLSPTGSWGRSASGSRGPMGPPGQRPHPSVVAAAFQGTNPHFYTKTWGVILVGGNKKSPSPQSNSSGEEAQQSAGSALGNLPEPPVRQQNSAPQTYSSPRPALVSFVKGAFGLGSSSSAQPANGATEPNGSTGRRRSATNPNPIPRTPTAAQLLLQQSGYAQMTGNVYGREREWKKSEDDRDRGERPPRRQDFQRGADRHRGGGPEGGSTSATHPPQQPQPSRAHQRHQEGHPSFRAHDQSFRGNQRQGQTRQRTSTGNDNGGLVSDGGSAEGGDLNVDAGYPLEHGASARARAGGRGRRKEEAARGKRAAGATIPDADLEPTTGLEPQSARSARFPGPGVFNNTNASPSSPTYYLDTSAGPEPGRSEHGRRARVRDGDFFAIDTNPNPNSRTSAQPSSIRSAQPAAGTPSRGFPLIVPPIPRRNRLAEGGSSHPSQRLAYSFTGAQTPSTSLLAASHFLGVNPARLTGGGANRSEYGEDYDAHDLFSQDGGSVHSVPSDSVARGRPALRANA